MPQLSLFGEHLRAWRRRRSLSQLDLALMAGTTSRYVSFIETGRSRPGRGVVLRLADAMEMPLRDRNALLVAAGLPAAFSESSLDDAVMSPVRRIIDRVLDNHEPFPATAMATGLRILKQNRAAERLFPGGADLTPEQVVDSFLAPGPGRDGLDNWPEVARATLASLRHDMLQHPSEQLAKLVKRAEQYEADMGPPAFDPSGPVMSPILRVGPQRVRTIATIMRFDQPTDVTSAELRVELMFPADDVSEAFFRGLAAQANTQSKVG